MNLTQIYWIFPNYHSQHFPHLIVVHVLLCFFMPQLVKLSGECDYLSVGLYEFDGLMLQFGEDIHGFLFGEVLSECFNSRS